MHTDITLLTLDHPGAHDPVYRLRRDHIAQLAQTFHEKGGAIPRAHYTAEETAVWRQVFLRLAPLHERLARRSYLEGKKRLNLNEHTIPELADLSAILQEHKGFVLHPIGGLVDSRSFLATLATRTMLCTQYIRHGSKPEYTPEPDVIHELIGHAPTFLDPEIVSITELFGETATRVDDEGLSQLERLYWFTLEFGLIEEPEGIRMLGAGILSSIGECERAFAPTTKRIPFDLEAIVSTPYDFSAMQPHYVICPPLPELHMKIAKFCEQLT